MTTCSRHDYAVPPATEGVEDTDGRAIHVPCDVRNVEQIDDVVGRTLDTFGRLDVLVNNAGGSPVAPTGPTSPRFHASVIAINLIGPLWFSQRANAVMQEQDSGGSIVNISSMASVTRVARARRLRGGQGRPQPLHAIPRRRVGAQGAHELHRPGHDRDRSARRGHLLERPEDEDALRGAATRSGASAHPRRSPTPASSSRAIAPPTSTAPRSGPTAEARGSAERGRQGVGGTVRRRGGGRRLCSTSCSSTSCSSA